MDSAVPAVYIECTASAGIEFQPVTVVISNKVLTSLSVAEIQQNVPAVSDRKKIRAGTVVPDNVVTIPLDKNMMIFPVYKVIGRKNIFPSEVQFFRVVGMRRRIMQYLPLSRNMNGSNA